ncbi:LTA synthase family protein [Thalassospiraceae bacterium LMO-JJ14]|nr:LTA synthase family protein [Thalassospiraceae bacterium LMO-JJ14]
MNNHHRDRSRLGVLVPISITYLAITFLIRLSLLVFEGNWALFSPLPLARIFSIGLLYDVAALSWILIPFVINALVWPDRPWGRKAHTSVAIFLVMTGAVIFGANTIGEFLFWNEFSARYNFIAVDYLIYTREVTGNIAQSYPMVWLVLACAGIILVMMFVTLPYVWRRARGAAPALKRRAIIAVGYVFLLCGVFFGVNETPHTWMHGAAEKELASNGHYALFRAFRNNDLDYEKFYATLPEDAAFATLRRQLKNTGLTPDETAQNNGFAHVVEQTGTPSGKNIVMVTIESLGADYVEAFGGAKGITPYLSALADESLIFSNFFATGLRTVRGLEAVTLSMPPTPGRAVPIRKNNKGLMSLGSVLEENGYENLYIYGGYSYFDNMKDFFGGNGYEVLDRTDIDDKDIHHETIWGVADEDLFTLALNTLDERTKASRPVFAHIMTTSNHRPYTYPENRIDVPSGSGRGGAAKYTDWAIGNFLEQAKTKPWFKDTIFVILADHTSHGRGRTDLPPEHYQIPLWIYAPGMIAPGNIKQLSSQIDVPPTILGLLNIGYTSSFFGQDILREGQQNERAFMANYLTVGYMKDGMIVELAPQGRVKTVRANDGRLVDADDPAVKQIVKEAISYYQTASHEIKRLTRP